MLTVLTLAMDEKYILIIIGGVAVCYGVVSAFRLKRSKSWPSFEGRIIRSRKKIERSDAGKLEIADIAYEYFIGEEKYSSEVIKIGGDMLSLPDKHKATDADRLLAKYPLDRVVDVYVDPKHPKVACLEKAGAETVYVSIIFGLLAVVIGLYFGEINALIHKAVTWLRN